MKIVSLSGNLWEGYVREVSGSGFCLCPQSGLPTPQECPSGIVNEENFKQIYSQFFPQGGEGTKPERKQLSISRLSGERVLEGLRMPNDKRHLGSPTEIGSPLLYGSQAY